MSQISVRALFAHANNVIGGSLLGFVGTGTDGGDRPVPFIPGDRAKGFKGVRTVDEETAWLKDFVTLLDWGGHGKEASAALVQAKALLAQGKWSAATSKLQDYFELPSTDFAVDGVSQRTTVNQLVCNIAQHQLLIFDSWTR
jgi:hypothetical protein